MSLLETILGGAMQGAGQSMIEEDRRKKEYIDEKRRLAEAERQYQRNRKDRVADENRALGREVKEQYPDLATNEMVTIYQNGREERRPLRAAELKQMEREDKEFEGKQRYQEAIINQMNRPSGGGGGSGRGPAKPSDSEARALAAMTAGPEPDKNVDPEAHAEWFKEFNRAFLAAKNGAAPPGARRALPGLGVSPVQMDPNAAGGPRDAARGLIQKGLPLPLVD